MFSRFLPFLCTMAVMVSCSNDNILRNKLRNVYSSPLIIPDSGVVFIDHSNCDLHQDGILNSEYVLFVFCGPDECSTCTMNKMSEWNSFLNLEKEGKITMRFMFNPPKHEIDNMIVAYHTSGLEHSVELDTCGAFLKKNPQIPQASIFHVLLLDNDGKILLVGNPLHNKDVRKLFYEIIEN